MSQDDRRGHQRYEVPYGVEVAAAWAWRVVIIAIAAWGGLWLLSRFAEITIPVAVALLLAALTIGAVDWLQRKGVPRILATFAIVIGLLVVIAGLFSLVGQQFVKEYPELRDSVWDGLLKLQDWLHDGPLGLTDGDINGWLEKARAAIEENQSVVVQQATEVGTLLTHLAAGFFIALFSTFFFLYEGDRIWDWTTRLFPRGARGRVRSSGRAAWASLTAFVRATVLVAATDAIGIAGIAWLLNVPLAAAIGVLVFLGAFVPILGALVSGMVAVLVALVTQGPWVALAMLGGVIAVQQLESHVLQPFLMGHLVAVHPLAIILAIGAGVVIAGVVGALLAVPFAACVNAVVRHLASGDPPSTDGVLGDESRDLGDPPPVEA